MKQKKKKSLESAGWKVGSTAEFLGLSEEEESLIAMKLSLSKRVKKFRQQSNFTQAHLAKLLDSSQSRIAKIEAADPSVSMELLVRALLALGATPKQIGATLGKSVEQNNHAASKKAS